MSFYELEPYLEEFMEYGSYGLLSNLWSIGLNIVAYVLTSLALYTVAVRRDIKNPWLSWIPVVNCWIIGSLSDQYRYVVKGQVKNKRKILLTLNIISWVISVAIVVLAVFVGVKAFGATIKGAAEEALLDLVLGPVFIILGLCVPMAGVGIAAMVVRYMAMYDIYTSCTPQNNVLFLVLSILFNIAEPFFLFFTRNKDEGMPPRRPEPVYEQPQEPWTHTENF